MSEVIAFILGTLFGGIGVICCALCATSKGGERNE